MRPATPIIETSTRVTSGAARSASFAATVANSAGVTSHTSRVWPGISIEPPRLRLMNIGASPHPDEACSRLVLSSGWGGAPAGARGSSQCELFIHRLQRSGGRCRPSLQPEPMMTLPRTAAEVLSGHVTLEIRCTDRVLLTFRQPRLQYGQGIHGFFCHHRGNQFASSALMMPMTEHFAAAIRHYIDTRRLELVRFAKGQSKDQVAKEYLAGRSGTTWTSAARTR